MNPGAIEVAARRAAVVGDGGRGLRATEAGQGSTGEASQRASRRDCGVGVSAFRARKRTAANQMVGPPGLR